MPPISSRLVAARRLVTSQRSLPLALNLVVLRNVVGDAAGFSNTAHAQLWMSNKEFRKKLKETSEKPLSKVPLHKRPQAIKNAQTHQQLLDIDRQAIKWGLSQEDIDFAHRAAYNIAVFLKYLLPLIVGPWLAWKGWKWIRGGDEDERS
ncbi:hypothetical protein BDZ45DRAFT_670437 [Acephala macrosclerotiorum]|nr:hypothetical protein BDZ45DRAFT_670437 [Acephala macrosclerotiorum]